MAAAPAINPIPAFINLYSTGKIELRTDRDAMLETRNTFEFNVDNTKYVGFRGGEKGTYGLYFGLRIQSAQDKYNGKDTGFFIREVERLKGNNEDWHFDNDAQVLKVIALAHDRYQKMSVIPYPNGFWE